MTILKNIFFILLLTGLIAACASGPERRTNKPTGPLSAYAKNKLVKEDPKALKRAAAGFERGGQASAALSLYLQVSAEYPQDREARRGVARTLIELGRRGEGIAQLKRLFAEDQNDRATRQALLRAYLKTVAINDAEAFLSPFIKDGTATLIEQLQYGVVLEVLGRTTEARDIWDGLQSTAPQESRSARYLAISFALDGAYETAVELLQQLLDNPATDREGRETLIYIYALSNQPEAAIAIANSILPPTEVDARRTMIELLPRMERRDQATAILLNRVSGDTIRRLTQPLNQPK